LTEKFLQDKEMSHVERAIYSYLRAVVRGVDVLIARNYRLFGVTTFIVALITSCTLVINNLTGRVLQEYIDFFLLGETVFALALLFSAIIFGSLITRKSRMIYLITLIIAGILFITVYFDLIKGEWLFLADQAVFYLWMVLLSISFMGLIHSFFYEWYGSAVWAGNPEGRILFSPFVKLGLIIAFILNIYLYNNFYTRPYFAAFSIFYGLSFLIAVISVFIIPKRRERGNVFGTIISYFYLYSLYHAYTAFIQGINSPVVIVDTILLTIGVLYTIQSMARRASKTNGPIISRVGEERSVMVVLALGLGYHVTTLRTFVEEGSIKEIISVYHQGSFIVCSLLMLFALLLYFVSRRFHNWFVTMPSTQDALKEVLKLYGPQAARIAMSALLNTSKERAQEVIRGAPDAITAGRRIFDEVRGWLSGKTDEQKKR